MTKNIDLVALRRKLRYEPETGHFYWIDSASNVAANGSVAGTLRDDGYIQIKVLGVIVLAHRLAWFYVTGEWPRAEIDHINGLRADNRFANMRDVPRKTNLQNERGPRKNNRTGLAGVSPFRGTFRASLRINGRQTHLGYFKTADEAHAAYVAAKRVNHPGFVL